ncbi:choline dehydrogenase-like flavoprotein [Microbacterium sp. SLBN-154]|uniref:GMC family oxidoreductase N-terminal domain-containing protein n=1 Tax=Microbacterium sp. SLBN-154 TaxID=2768458 RepID=UPI001150C1E0|nr:GMC family oxidoreductase N-terminal domain-containing protein [Microbacterium sp. SLBN-154]TQK18577.1 choline dehydrogenase-like flavoprotein [Microbacterium sp. SLBN-154]
MTTLIVGAGSSGSALAARLTEDDGRDVILVEAGPADPDFAPDVRDASSIRGAMPGHPANWSFLGHLTPDLAYTVVRGRMLGGSSAINGAYFVRARSGDHARWAQVGGDRWSYDAALPVWRAIESDVDFPDSPMHGSTGPMPVRRPAPGALAAAFLRAARVRGHAEEPDKNGEGVPGAGPVPSNIRDGQRVNTAMAYLPGAVRARPGLRILDRTTVGRVIFDGIRAIGVETSRGEIRADEVVLSAGAIGSARILLASGVGPAADLERFDIRVRADLPVGTAFSDHPDISLSWRPDGPTIDPAERFAFPAAVNIDTGGHPDADVEILLSVKPLGYLLTGTTRTLAGGLGAALRHPLRTARAVTGISARRAAMQVAHRDDLPLIVGLQCPAGRGSLALQAPDPAAPPRIEYRYLADVDDRRRLRAGIREAAALVRDMGGRLTELNESDLDDETLDAWMLSHLGTAIHMCGTAPMGPVVDGAGRVHGLAGLRVADTSILPVVPTRGPAASAVLVGEVIARAMRER